MAMLSIPLDVRDFPPPPRNVTLIGELLEGQYLLIRAHEIAGRLSVREPERHSDQLTSPQGRLRSQRTGHTTRH